MKLFIDNPDDLDMSDVYSYEDREDEDDECPYCMGGCNYCLMLSY